MCHEGTQFLLCTFLFIFFNNLYFYFWLCWVFMAERGLSPVVDSGGHSPAAAHKTLTMERRLNCPMKCGIFLDQGLNRVPCIGRQILNPWTTREVLHSPSWVSLSGGSQSPWCDSSSLVERTLKKGTEASAMWGSHLGKESSHLSWAFRGLQLHLTAWLDLHVRSWAHSTAQLSCSGPTETLRDHKYSLFF